MEEPLAVLALSRAKAQEKLDTLKRSSKTPPATITYFEQVIREYDEAIAILTGKIIQHKIGADHRSQTEKLNK